MSYPTGAQIRALLPVENPGVSEAECQAFVDEWKEAVDQAYGLDPAATPPVTQAPETPRTRRIVREGALADAELRLLSISGYYGDSEAIGERLKWAEEALASYDAEYSSPSEPSRVRLGPLPW